MAGPTRRQSVDVGVVVTNPPYAGDRTNARLFSNPQQLERIRDILRTYQRLPLSGNTIPGAVMEGVLELVTGGERLPTYDFVDVIHRARRVGWQVKSTAEKTPLTWKRAKLENQVALMGASRSDGDAERQAGLAALGKAIIDFCNKAVSDSFELYGLDAIGYARLIVHPGSKKRGTPSMATYFERQLAVRGGPPLFRHEDYEWHWTTEKVGKKKQQLSALHGTTLVGNKRRKIWAWHGQGENQLHFSGEGLWWPRDDDMANVVRFVLPSERVNLTVLTRLLEENAADLAANAETVETDEDEGEDEEDDDETED